MAPLSSADIFKIIGNAVTAPVLGYIFSAVILFLFHPLGGAQVVANPDLVAEGLFLQMSLILAGGIMVVLVGVPLALLVGLPIFVLQRRWGVSGPFSFCLVGLALGYIGHGFVVWRLSMVPEFFQAQAEFIELLTYASAIVGWLFFWMNVRRYRSLPKQIGLERA